MANSYTSEAKQTGSQRTHNLAANSLVVLAIVASAAAGVATLVRIAAPEYPFFGPDQYVNQAFPYMLLVILAIVFRRTVSGATISLIGALMLGGLGVFAIYTAGGEIDTLGFTPIALVAGWALVLLAQLIRMVMMRSVHRKN